MKVGKCSRKTQVNFITNRQDYRYLNNSKLSRFYLQIVAKGKIKYPGTPIKLFFINY